MRTAVPMVCGPASAGGGHEGPSRPHRAARLDDLDVGDRAAARAQVRQLHRGVRLAPGHRQFRRDGSRQQHGNGDRAPARRGCGQTGLRHVRGLHGVARDPARRQEQFFAVVRLVRCRARRRQFRRQLRARIRPHRARPARRRAAEPAHGDARGGAVRKRASGADCAARAAAAARGKRAHRLERQHRAGARDRVRDAAAWAREPRDRAHGGGRNRAGSHRRPARPLSAAQRHSGRGRDRGSGETQHRRGAARQSRCARLRSVDQGRLYAEPAAADDFRRHHPAYSCQRATAGADGTLTRPRPMLSDRRRVAVALAGFCVFLNLYAPQSVLPLLAGEFAVGAGQASLAITASTLAVALMAPFAGTFADVVGRRRVIVAAMFALVVPTIMVALAPGIHAHWAGWRIAFLALAALTLLLALGVAALLEQERRFVRSQNLAASARQMLRHFRNPRLAATYAIGFGVLFTFIASFTYVNFYLAAPPFRLSATALGLIFVVYLGGSAIAPLTGRAVARFGGRPLVLAAIGLWIGGMLLTLVPWLPAIVVGLAISATCGFLCQSVSTSFVALAAERGHSSAVGLYVTWYYIGGSVGGALPGLIWNRTGWPGCVAMVVAVLVLMAAMVWRFWRAPLQREVSPGA